MVDETLLGFIKWLRKWFVNPDISSMIYGMWRAADGVPVHGGIISAGEFLHLIAEYAGEAKLGRGSGLEVEVIDGPFSVHVVEHRTRTLLIDLHLEADARVDEKLASKLLREALRQLEEAEGLMAVRIMIS